MPRDLRSKGLAAAAPKPISVASLAGKQHQHGCIDCHCAYTCGCRQPELDRQCNDCRQGRDTYIQMGMYPAACCGTRRLATRKERETYKLAGLGNWWICTTCWRRFTAPGEER